MLHGGQQPGGHTRPNVVILILEPEKIQKLMVFIPLDIICMIWWKFGQSIS